MDVENAIVVVSQGPAGLTVHTSSGFSDTDCVSLLCAISLNFEHGLHDLTAEELLAAAISAVEGLRRSAGPRVFLRKQVGSMGGAE